MLVKRSLKNEKIIRQVRSYLEKRKEREREGGGGGGGGRDNTTLSTIVR